MDKRADLEDLEQAQEEEQAEADAIAETEVTPMTTRPHQMPNNSEEEDRFDKGEGSSPDNVEPEDGESEEGESEDDTEGMPFDDDDDTEGTPEESDDEDSEEEDDDMPDFMKEEALIPVVCRACTRKFSMNQVKLGLRCICGSDDLDLDDDEDEGTDSGDSSDYTGASPTTSALDDWQTNIANETSVEKLQDALRENDNLRYHRDGFPVGHQKTLDAQDEAIRIRLKELGASKTALEVDSPDAEIPAPGGAVGDTPIPPTVQPASSDSPQAEELPDNQQFAEPFTEDDGEAVEEKVEAIAKDIFKSQGVSRRQALLLAHKVVAEFPVIASKTASVPPPSREQTGRQYWTGLRANNFDEVDAIVREYEAELGGAWSWANVFGELDLVRAQSPSQIPDEYHDMSHDKIFYKGQWQGFTDAAKIREQNRGLGAE